jgi:hypothetical protein
MTAHGKRTAAILALSKRAEAAVDPKYKLEEYFHCGAHEGSAVSKKAVPR